MTLERFPEHVEKRIKAKIAGWTGLPKCEDLPINNNIAPGNLIATRPFFEKEAELIYNAVDRLVFWAETRGLIK